MKNEITLYNIHGLAEYFGRDNIFGSIPSDPLSITVFMKIIDTENVPSIKINGEDFYDGDYFKAHFDTKDMLSFGLNDIAYEHMDYVKWAHKHVRDYLSKQNKLTSQEEYYLKNSKQSLLEGDES